MTLAISHHILLVEDDPGHAELIRRNLARSGVGNELTWVSTGERAMDFVHRRSDFSGRESPRSLLMILDVNIPGRLDGIDVLREVKRDRELRCTPVVMLTTTEDPREVRRCYDIGCNVYLTKPVDPVRLADTLKRLGAFLSVVNLPELHVES